mgnify:CR=1 FL=1
MTDLSIMYSGGLDSLIMYNYARYHGFDPICLYVDFGHPYAEKELKSIKKNNKWTPEVEVIKLDSLYNLVESRLSNQIIPSRNLLLSTIGAMFSPRVWIGALDGEQLGKEHDKSERFFEDSTKLLTFTNEFFQQETIIEAPFANMSKSETINWALNVGKVPLDVLLETSSCYSGTDEKCGKCLTCIKRYIAFLSNGIIEPGYKTDPLKSEYFKELNREIPLALKNRDFSRFTPKRIKEFLDVKEMYGDLIDSN